MFNRTNADKLDRDRLRERIVILQTHLGRAKMENVRAEAELKALRQSIVVLRAELNELKSVLVERAPT